MSYDGTVCGEWGHMHWREDGRGREHGGGEVWVCMGVRGGLDMGGRLGNCFSHGIREGYPLIQTQHPSLW